MTFDSGLEDRTVVRRVLDGDAAAFADVVDRYGGRLYNAVYRIVGSPEDARDLVQDALVKAYEHLGRFRGGSTLYTWLFRIAVNTALSHRRRRARSPVVGSVGTGGDDCQPVRWADPSGADPADPLMSAETERLVQEALASLDDRHRTVLVLRDLQHFEYEEIASILDVPDGTVKSRLHRARLMLRDRLRPMLSA